MKRSAVLAGVKKQVLEAPAYTLRAYVEGIKLNQNENPHDFPDDLKEEVWRRFRNRPWSRYPDFVPDGLRARLAAFAGWKKDGVLVGNGSNELLQATLMVVVNERASVAIPVPTFTVYGLVARVLGGRIVSIPLDAEMRYDVDQLIERSEEAAVRALIVCTPNNPTGSVLEKRDLERILDHFSGSGNMVLKDLTILLQAYYGILDSYNKTIPAFVAEERHESSHTPVFLTADF